MKRNDQLFDQGKRHCKICKEIKILNDFWKDKNRRNGYDAACKKCTKKRQRGEWKRFGSQPIRMYQRLQQSTQGKRSKKGLYRHQLTISKEEFIEWYNSQAKVCVYCKLDLNQFLKVRNKFGKQAQKTSRFGIDRKDNNLPYSLNNIVLSCVTCNGLKGYFFDFTDFCKIAKTYITPKLEKILKNE